MNRQYRRVLPLLTAAALAATPMEALAENPQFAHDEATWERLKDNVMEYDELSLLVEEYNPNYQNEQASYNDTKNDDDAAQIRRDAKDSAQDMYDSAEDLKEQAEDLSSMADDLSDQAQAALDAGNPALAAQLQAGAASYMAGYAPLMSAAAMTQNSALKSDISADSSYVDSDMRKIQHVKNQKGIIVSTQNLFNSYNQLRANAALIQKNVEVMEAALRATETQASIGMATQADVLKAQKNLQSIQSTQTETLASLETLRQNLCMMTGWSYDAQPEIREVPHANGDAIAQINLEADTQTALANNYDLQYSRRALGNMQENSTDRKNQERTVKNLEQTVSATMTNLYNDIRQEADCLAVSSGRACHRGADHVCPGNKEELRMACDIEYLQEQSTYLSKQVAEQTADMALFQAIETYQWAVNGYMNTSGS